MVPWRGVIFQKRKTFLMDNFFFSFLMFILDLPSNTIHVPSSLLMCFFLNFFISDLQSPILYYNYHL